VRSAPYLLRTPYDEEGRLTAGFVGNGLLDNSFPYPDRQSLPPLMRRDHDASYQFLELQAHIMSTACQIEKGLDSPHVYAYSGDRFFQNLEKLGKGGEAQVFHRRSPSGFMLIHRG
jgi:hypothetical protein